MDSFLKAEIGVTLLDSKFDTAVESPTLDQAVPLGWIHHFLRSIVILIDYKIHPVTERSSCAVSITSLKDTKIQN